MINNVIKEAVLFLEVYVNHNINQKQLFKQKYSFVEYYCIYIIEIIPYTVKYHAMLCKNCKFINKCIWYGNVYNIIKYAVKMK